MSEQKPKTDKKPDDREFTQSEKEYLAQLVSEAVGRAVPTQPIIHVPVPSAPPQIAPNAFLRVQAFLSRLVGSGVLNAVHGELRHEAEQCLAALGGPTDYRPATPPNAGVQVKPLVPFEVYAAAERVHHRQNWQGDVEIVMGYANRYARVTDVGTAVQTVIATANEWGIEGGPAPGYNGAQGFQGAPPAWGVNRHPAPGFGPVNPAYPSVAGLPPVVNAQFGPSHAPQGTPGITTTNPHDPLRYVAPGESTLAGPSQTIGG